MDGRLQAKLLRAIQEREIDRVGGSKPIKVDIRVLATSNRDLVAEVENGTFREDLLFRLNVLNLKIPPLRDRPADIPVLCEHFIERYSEANGVAVRPLAKGVEEQLNRHPWKGNVRELENTMHRAVLLATSDEITLEAILLPDGTRPGEAGAIGGGETVLGSNGEGVDSITQLVGRTVADVERDLIIDTLQHCLGNRTHAANILGISIRTLRNKLKQYGEEGRPIPMPGEVSQPAL